jgi:hypothetical protein
MERNNDLDINMYDAFYRNLDVQIGRFWEVDPQTIFSVSVYASMGNNPINNSDWLGDYFTWVNGTVKATYSRMREENCRRLDENMKELSTLLNSTDEKAQQRTQELVTLINGRAELNSQWDEMDTSPVEFYVSSEQPEMKGLAGDASYSVKDMRVNIRLGKAEKDISTMAHEFRHGYGYLNGELTAGGNGLYDITDEVVANKAGFLMSNNDAVKAYAQGKVTVEWFKKNHLDSDAYRHLTGREESLTINTPAATYMKYFDDRLARFMIANKNNTNFTVKDAIDAANKFTKEHSNNPIEFRYGDLLKR